MNQRTRKLLTIKALHLLDDIERIYLSRKEEGRELDSLEDRVAISIRGLEDDIKMSKERLITSTSNKTDNIRTNRSTTKTRKLR